MGQGSAKLHARGSLACALDAAAVARAAALARGRGAPGRMAGGSALLGCALPARVQPWPASQWRRQALASESRLLSRRRASASLTPRTSGGVCSYDGGADHPGTGGGLPLHAGLEKGRPPGAGGLGWAVKGNALFVLLGFACSYLFLLVLSLFVHAQMACLSSMPGAVSARDGSRCAWAVLPPLSAAGWLQLGPSGCFLQLGAG